MSFNENNDGNAMAAAATGASHPDAVSKPGYDPAVAERVRAERAARREERRKQMIEFRPRESVAVIDIAIALNAEVVKKNFHLWYARAQSAAFMLRDVLERMTSREQHEQAESIVNAKIQGLRKDMDAALARLKAVAADVGLRQERKFTAPRELVVPAYTPEAMDFLHLIRVYDEMIWYVEALQIMRGIKNSEKIKLRSEYRSKLNNLAREISRIWVRAKAASRREIEARDSAAAARLAAASGDDDQGGTTDERALGADADAAITAQAA